MASHQLSIAEARRIWIHAQRLDTRDPFGSGPDATRLASEHLGYVQIDTINVIERSHHHILYSRIPTYAVADLHHAQSVEKSVFEYWTHALAYVPLRDLAFFVPQMKAHRKEASRWLADVPTSEVRRLARLIAEGGPITIRDIDDDVLVDKIHPWASRKPSKRALQRGFFDGRFAISQRIGMLKTFDLMERHFGWPTLPKAASERAVTAYLLDRALRAQGIVSLDSICHLDAASKPAVQALIDLRVKRKQLVPVELQGVEKTKFWMAPELLDAQSAEPELVHILSPFDPLIIQRKRLKQFFGYDHVFEAYVPKEKRKFGYFTLPVLVGDQIVAAIDLKTDRSAGKLLVQSWHWIGRDTEPTLQCLIEEELHRFERFQLAASAVLPLPRA